MGSIVSETAYKTKGDQNEIASKRPFIGWASYFKGMAALAGRSQSPLLLRCRYSPAFIPLLSVYDAGG
jgi:hypothetical protein